MDIENEKILFEQWKQIPYEKGGDGSGPGDLQKLDGVYVNYSTNMQWRAWRGRANMNDGEINVAQIYADLAKGTFLEQDRNSNLPNENTIELEKTIDVSEVMTKLSKIKKITISFD